MTRSAGPAVLDVHVQPRAKSSEVVGFHGEAIKVRLRSPPVDGAANEELIRLLADLLKIDRRDVELVSGETSRRKRIRINGLGLNQIYRALRLSPERLSRFGDDA